MMFDPFELDEDITPKAAKMHIRNSNYYLALSMALRLNEPDLIRKSVFEKVSNHLLNQNLSLELLIHLAITCRNSMDNYVIP